MALKTDDTASAAMSPKYDLLFGWGLVLLFCVGFLLFLWHSWAIDLSALYFASHFYDVGQTDLVYLPGYDVAPSDLPPAYAAFADVLGESTSKITPYLYPPLWLALLAPITRNLSLYQFYELFHFANLLALAGTIWLSFRMSDQVERLGFGRWALLSLMFAGGTLLGYFGITLGQPQILVSFFIVLAFFLLAEQRDIGAGMALALAAAMKLSPAVLVLIFVMERRWRGVAAFALVGAAFGLASVNLTGWPLHAEWLAKLSEINGHVLVARISAGIEMHLFRLNAILQGQESKMIDLVRMLPEAGWISSVVRFVLIAGVLAIWASTRHLPERPRIWSRLIAMLLLTLLTNPLPWNHYLLLVLLLLPGLVQFLPAHRVSLICVAVYVPLSLPAYFVVFEPIYMAYSQAFMQLVIVIGLLGAVLWLSARASKR